MDLPAKYRNLFLLLDRAPIPPMICLSHRELAQLFEDFQAALDRLDSVIEKIHITSGAFLADHLSDIAAIVDAIRPVPDADARLERMLAETFGDRFQATAFAVRSANRHEDLAGRSFAGIYETELEVQGASAILSALKRVWASAFRRPALAEQLHGNVRAPADAMMVIIQRMVESRLSGVAFSRDPVDGSDRCVIEFVEGLGEQLVSGAVAARRVDVLPDGSVIGDASPDAVMITRPVAGLVTAARDALGYEVDIEWGWDGETVWLLQARPISTLRTESDGRSATALLDMADLYGDDARAIERLGPLPEFATYFRSKRKPLYDFAHRHGLGAGTAKLIRLNALALSDTAFRSRFEAAFHAPQVVIDHSERVRQIVVARDRMVEELLSLCPDPTRVHTIVIRDFIAGTIGLISQVVENGSVFCEASRDGLLALNRGTARTDIVDLDGGSDAVPELDMQSRRRLRDATLAARSDLGPIQIEWVLAAQTLYPIDFSPVTDKMLVKAARAAVLSPGMVHGPRLLLEDDDDLRALSVAPVVSLTEVPDASTMGKGFADLVTRLQDCSAKPIVVTPRPYAALASVLPYVSGFVFEAGSMLCHLAILLREHGIPAVQGADLYAAARDQDFVTIASDRT